ERYVWHPYTQMQLVPRAIGVERGEGAYLYLADGRSVFDSISSWWVTLHGHAHPKIAHAIAEQAAKLEQVIFAGFTHEPAAQLAKKLVEITPDGLDKVFFSDDGSTAVEAAIKMCLQYWKQLGEDRTEILALDHAYHGDTFGAMSISARGPFTKPFEELLFSVRRLPFPASDSNSDTFSLEESRFLDEMREAAKQNTIAAFIYEPLLLGSGGMLVWRASVLEAALGIAKEYGILTIADEVLTGFGRTGTMFASDQVSLKPDLMTLSKGIPGGFLPMGVTMASSKIFEAFLSNDRTRTFFHGHSYTGNPISAAAALASLDIFETEPVFERITTIASAHADFAPKLAAKYQLQCRQIGTIAAFEPKESAGYLSTN
ncbi:MAG TPA: adenosylmethionine--8-amino-7-oxononanoate transaminase, partial [Candidatus Kapabacteria bacterium]|nr:adenosylmethionine--8-amino-7-oxononanoate transaminase [Candidatus Kapabacteria bacterium]